MIRGGPSFGLLGCLGASIFRYLWYTHLSSLDAKVYFCNAEGRFEVISRWEMTAWTDLCARWCLKGRFHFDGVGRALGPEGDPGARENRKDMSKFWLPFFVPPPVLHRSRLPHLSKGRHRADRQSAWWLRKKTRLTIQTHLCDLQLVWTWASDCPCLGLSFLMWKTRKVELDSFYTFFVSQTPWAVWWNSGPPSQNDILKCIK